MDNVRIMDNLNIQPAGTLLYVAPTNFIRVCRTSEALVGVIRASTLSVALSQAPTDILYSSGVPVSVAPIRFESSRVIALEITPQPLSKNEALLLLELPSAQEAMSVVEESEIPLLKESEEEEEAVVSLHVVQDIAPLVNQSLAVLNQPRTLNVWERGILAVSTGVTSVFNLGCTLLSLQKTHTLRTLKSWLTTMAPALHQLVPEHFEHSLQQVITLENPLNPFQFHEVSRRGSMDNALASMMRSHCVVLAPVEHVDNSLEKAISSAARVGNVALTEGDQAYNFLDSARGTWAAAKTIVPNMTTSVAQMSALTALSKADAKECAKACTLAMQCTIQETLHNMSESQKKGAGAAHFLGHSPTVRALSYLGDKLLSDFIEGALLQMNRAVNVKFTQSRVLDAVGQIVINTVIDNIPQEAIQISEGALEAVQHLTANLPIDRAQRMILDLHFLQYLKHTIVLQDALMKSGTIDFNVILASKEGRGDALVEEAFTALCSVISRGDSALTAKIEGGLRNVLAVGELAMHVASDRTLLINDLAEAAKKDGFISEGSSRYVHSKVTDITGGILAWWKEPSGPEVERFKQLVSEGAKEASLVSRQASHSHLEQAMTQAIQRGTDVLRWNRAAAVGVQAAGVGLVGAHAAGYRLFGADVTSVEINWQVASRILGALMSAGTQIALTEGVLYAKNPGIALAMSAVKPDDRLASAVNQFCVLSEHVVQGMS